MKHFWLTSLALMGTLPVHADDFFGSVETKASTDTARVDSPWQHRAWLTQTLGYGYRSPAAPTTREKPDLTRVETELYGQLDWREGNWRIRLAGSVIQDWLPDMERTGLWSGYEFTREQSDQRQWRGEISDTYLSWQSGNWWLLGGYQTLAWGEAESQRVTDVLARRDQRWPGQEQLDDLRLPVPVMRATWNGRLDLVLLPDTPPDRLPAAAEAFDPYLAWRAPNMPTPVLQRRHDMGWALRWQTRRPGWDMQWLLAEVNSFERYPLVPAAEHDQDQMVLTPKRQRVAGMSLQSSRGAWVWRTEQALHRAVPVPGVDPSGSWPEQDQWRSMVSAEYAGINDLTLTAELSQQYLHNPAPGLNTDQWQHGGSLRARYTALNERLELSGQLIRLPGGEGDVMRVSAEWTFSDQFSAKLSAIDYFANHPQDQLYPYRHNDTLLFSIHWNL